MPFPPVKKLPPNPAVRIFFSGLLILEPRKEGSKYFCEVFVNRSAPDHHLSIEVRRKRPGKPDMIVMRHIGPLAFAGVPEGQPRLHGMFIRSKSEGVKAYHGAATRGGHSLRCAIDFDDLHEGNAGTVHALGGRPSILLRDGILYAADKTPPDLIVTLKKGSYEKRLPPIASIIGANIYLSGDERMFIRWRQDGRDMALPLKKLAGGASYEIYINNDPLFEQKASDIPEHEEFAEYYKILPDVKSEDQFTLDFKPPKTRARFDDERGSTTTPCMPGIKGGGG